MTLWGIADIHASRLDPHTRLPQKPMDIFGDQWSNHLQRLTHAWRNSVAPSDTVVVAGDTDWGLHLADAMDTLSLLESLPGRKILLRGNHDYWWSSKTTNRVRSSLPASISALHNTAEEAEGFNLCGAKGSPVPGGPDWTQQDEKLLSREVQRLQLSLEKRDPSLPTIVALHYPPFYGHDGESRFRGVLESSGVACVIYGHLHGQSGVAGPHGYIGGIAYHLVASDATEFHPVPLAREGVLLSDVRAADGPSL